MTRVWRTHANYLHLVYPKTPLRKHESVFMLVCAYLRQIKQQYVPDRELRAVVNLLDIKDEKVANKN